MLGGNGMYAFAKTRSYSDNDGTWHVTNTITVTSSKTTSKIKCIKAKKEAGYYVATAASYDKNGRVVAYKGAYQKGTEANATARKLFKVRRGKACNWVADKKKVRQSAIWSKTMNK